MKANSPISLVTGVLFALLLVVFGFSKQSAMKKESSGDSFTVNFASLSEGINLSEVHSDAPPALFQFVMESDYVVIASRISIKVIGKRIKRPDQGNILNMEDRLVGAADTYQIEDLLFAKASFMSGEHLNTNTIRSFQIYRKIGDWNGHVQDNVLYLLFLEEIAKDDEVFSTLELDKDRSYYRPYVGTQSIFPGESDPIHGKNMLGRIDLSREGDSKLVEEIRQFCAALSSGDNKDRIRNLKGLAKSKDEILRENAEYAIGFLSRKEEK